jgi:hypothetical protein
MGLERANPAGSALSEVQSSNKTSRKHAGLRRAFGQGRTERGASLAEGVILESNLLQSDLTDTSF